MRPRFESDLNAFSEVAKDDIKREEAPANSKEADTEEDLDSVISAHLNDAAANQHTSTAVQHKIFEIQKEKQRVMEKLRVDLHALDQSDEKIEASPDARILRFSSKKNQFLYKDDNGKAGAATFGEILTDMEWGIQYEIGDKSVPRALAKRYLVEQAKHTLREYLDQQIIKSEAGRGDADERVRDTYIRIAEKIESGEKERQMGFKTEKIVKNFLKKQTIDEELPVEIYDADVYQDVHQKIDFVIHRKEKNRAVRVDADDRIGDLGIQFTLNPEAAEQKKYQIKRSKKKLLSENNSVQDIALVVFPMEGVQKLIRDWEKAGRPAGGPDKALPRVYAKELFERLLEIVCTDEEIAEHWQKVESHFVDVPVPAQRPRAKKTEEAGDATYPAFPDFL